MPVVITRLERLFALCPENSKCSFGLANKAAANVSDKGSRSEAKKLSPKTAERVEAVATLGPDVTRTTLAEHEKALSSAEASVMKALQLLNKLSAELEAQREKDAAKESRASEIRARRTKDLENVKKAARRQGKHEADQAWSLLVDWNNYLSHRVNWHVEEWSGSVCLKLAGELNYCYSVSVSWRRTAAAT